MYCLKLSLCDLHVWIRYEASFTISACSGNMIGSMASTDNIMKDAKLHNTANNKRILKVISKTSLNKHDENIPQSSKAYSGTSETSARKQHHNKGKSFGTPFKKGHSAYSHTPKNPISLLEILRSELNRIPTKEEDGFDGRGKSNAWWLIHEYVQEARGAANIQAIKDILDRLEGKPAQAITGAGGGPIQLNQNVNVVDEQGIRGAVEALVECGAMSFNPN